ncbi:MAG: acyl-ACP--UDP-N-acetylglucosamine O-acyltransferase [Planctomycetota bacterium]
MIHSTAVVDPQVELSDTAEIGPWCHLSGNVKVGARTRLLSNVTVFGNTTIGSNCYVSPFTVLGGIPQDPKYKFEECFLEIGDDNRIHEFVTIHSGCEPEGTSIGHANIIMSHSHIGHDATIGDQCKIASYCAFAGHVMIGDHVNVSGLVGINQFCRIGSFAFISARSNIRLDAPPFAFIHGTDSPPRIRGANIKGLRRAGIPKNEIRDICLALRKWQADDASFAEAIREIEFLGETNMHARQLAAFIKNTRRGVLRTNTNT